MVPRETIHKAKALLQKTLRSFKSLVFGGDQFYNEFYDILQSDLNRIRIRNDEISMNPSREPPPVPPSTSVVEEGRSIIDKKQSPLKKNKGENNNDGLAKKMKELEMMMDTGDVEHVLDIEEALHYYSRLKSPVYLDIVDKFFMDMHTEFNVPSSLPHSSSVRVKRSKSKARFGSLSGCR
ncbi:hypothetical protein PIB30_032734 [Stylosanthes scabra]|uniref:Uncharacterized protein n=1 Tax=Stylosanthes scabra TaxID=79078 RepID=A0ABU6SCK0_9FABA|nr:hypothetical protein [Stylosanthes scabra]